jgi:hypothetical protein
MKEQFSGASTDDVAAHLNNFVELCEMQKYKDAFIGKYYPPAKIISLKSDIVRFKQFDNEHVAQAWERMKSLIKNCPTHGLTTWMIIQTFYAGLNFSSRNLLDLAAGGTFMSITLAL